MIKLKVYLDTSVVSHLLADDAPEQQNDTLKLWLQLKQDEYDAVVSPVVYEEIEGCDEDLGTQLLRNLNELNPTNAEETMETRILANEYLRTGILKQKSLNDCRHIAIASIYGCKYILSWNMKHFVKRRTIEMVQNINRNLGIIQPSILTPAIFIEGDDEGEDI